MCYILPLVQGHASHGEPKFLSTHVQNGINCAKRLKFLQTFHKNAFFRQKIVKKSEENNDSGPREGVEMVTGSRNEAGSDTRKNVLNFRKCRGENVRKNVLSGTSPRRSDKNVLKMGKCG